MFARRPNVHVEIVVAALEAGKHVVCEKPLAIRSSDAERVAAAAKRSGRIFMPAMVMRFWPEWSWLKEAVESGPYGRVRGATFRRVGSRPGGWFTNDSLSGGGLFDLHVHDVDFVYHLFGRPRAVFSRGFGPDVRWPEHVVTQYIYDEVPMVVAEGGWGVAGGYGFTMRYTVSFEKATADFDAARAQPLMVSENGKATAVECAGPDGYQRELAYFVECVKAGSAVRVGAEDALAGVRMLEAEQRSMERGEVVGV